MLSEGKKYRDGNEERLVCLELARIFVSSLKFPISELPAELLVTPLQLRNECNEKAISETKDTHGDHTFLNSIKQNVKNMDEQSKESLYHVPSKFSKVEEVQNTPIKETQDQLDVESSPLRQEIVIRVFSFFEIYVQDKKQPKKQKFWKTRKSFVKEILRWLQPLTIYMDPPSPIKSNHFQEFIFSLEKMWV